MFKETLIPKHYQVSIFCRNKLEITSAEKKPIKNPKSSLKRQMTIQEQPKILPLSKALKIEFYSKQRKSIKIKPMCFFNGENLLKKRQTG